MLIQVWVSAVVLVVVGRPRVARQVQELELLDKVMQVETTMVVAVVQVLSVEMALALADSLLLELQELVVLV